MKAVWKYPLTGWGPGSKVRHSVTMPDGAVLLTLQDQQGVATLWAEVDPAAPTVTRSFEWFGTGHPMPADGRYVGTAQVRGGAFVFHLYEVPA